MKNRKVMAVASAGGHWVQLNRLSPAFSECSVLWMSTVAELRGKVPFGRYAQVKDASMWNKPGLIIMAIQVCCRVVMFRPDVVITTGAAPGFFALVFGKVFGARTIWIDSIANSEEMSLSGKKAGRWADHWLTQWPELAHEGGPDYRGAVL